uniref:protein FAR1-RELATED SEQUENCE 2-like n=1 Tax=Fragaria vesca subsp. vesca TaxID=101020 RepID=UPI0005CB128E|nr:PREDICTED: protein FAR1-RELATED SEQUENCE 2-like [Fragaria vesca subsp. vesca]
MSKSLMIPKDILNAIKSRDPTNTSTLRTIYNARQAARVRSRAGRTQMQHLLKNLHDHHYIEYHRSVNHVVTDLFWCHSFSLQILRTFPHVLIMDCTYKTNRYRFPLFEIVGITCTKKTFNVAFVYMSKEAEDNYTWALSRLKIILGGNDSMPEVIVTDRELALMKAVHQVFPETRHILCKWHISKNVLKKCKASFATKAGWEMFITDWNSLVDSLTEDDYLRNLAALEVKYFAYAKEMNYLKTTWLNKYKELFVAAWTSKYMHLGARTSNRVESAHAKLKRELKSSQLDFSVSWEHIHSLLCLHHVEVKASFEKSRCFVQHDFRHTYLRDLIGFVSISALNMIVCEANNADNIGQELALCNCAIRKTHGLPCAHEIAEYKLRDRPIPLSSVHRHWRRLEIITTTEDSELPDKVPVKTHLDRLAEWAEVQDEETKRQILVKIDELMNPSCTLLKEPAEKIKTKGRPSKVDASTRRCPSGFEIVDALLSERDSPSSIPSAQKGTSTSHGKKANDQAEKTKSNKPTSKDPRFEITQKYSMQYIFGMRPYITGSMDVEDDGNCDFRVVAAAMGFGRKHWRKVRTDLINGDELEGIPNIYEGLFGGPSGVERLHRRLNHFASNMAPKARWMDCPDMGHLIATCYGVLVVNISDGQCFTFLPLHEYVEGKLMEADLHEIGIGFVNSNHFVQICFVPGHPLPPVPPNWIYHADDAAKSLYLRYQDRFQQYTQLPHPERVVNTSSSIMVFDDEQTTPFVDVIMFDEDNAIHLSDH